MPSNYNNIRPNLAGDFPQIHPTALIDPSAQIIGNVKIDKDVFVGPSTVIRADQRGADGKVVPIHICEEVNIQDGVIIHTDPGAPFVIGPKTSIAHGVTIHGPCNIGHECFIAVRASLYKVTLEEHVWVGHGAIVQKVTLHSFTMVPTGAVILERPETLGLRLVTDEERKYMEEAWAANSRLRMDYLELRDKAEAIRSNIKKKE
jgi:carbonic anhydrase